jgi:hypothetical protein
MSKFARDPGVELPTLCTRSATSFEQWFRVKASQDQTTNAAVAAISGYASVWDGD